MSSWRTTETGPTSTLPRYIGIAAVLVFLLYALNFLYFFIDDEGIPFVFAQNLLDGRGLVYNSFEGRVEGYSDFLQVLLGAGWLALARAAALDKICVFFFGKAFSLIAGAATVALVFGVMRRLPGIRPAGAVAGLTFLALAGPLAMWSCSSLEAAFVVLLVTTLAAALLAASPSGDRVAFAAGVLLVLLRIDGFVHAGAVLGSFWIFSDSTRRRQLVRSILLPLAAVFIAYHAWRVWYFGEWLMGPLYSKILYKLLNGPGWVIYKPETSYGYRFLDTYNVLIAVPALLLLAAWCWKARIARPVMLAGSAIGLYAASVGDWMAGFRFFTSMLPLLAIAIAGAVSAIQRTVVARMAAAVLTIWFGWTAYGYALNYHHKEFGGSWWVNRSLAVDRFFGPDYELFREARHFLAPGTRTAFNQAGFLPFMLDLDNLDDVGLCSLFAAKMPTTDVIFTEPGRYSPLTNLPSLRTANAYVLYRDPAYVIARMDIMVSANRGRLPEDILDGRYRLKLVDTPRENVVYARTNVPVTPFQTNPNTFLENVAHTSRIRSAVWNGGVVSPPDYVERLGFLAGEWLDVAVDPRLHLAVQFADEEIAVYELHINGLQARHAMAVVLTLEGIAGGRRHRTEFQMEGRTSRDLRLHFPEPLRVARLTLDLASLDAGPASARIFDLRVQGQPPALAAYVRKLPFPPH